MGEGTLSLRGRPDKPGESGVRAFVQAGAGALVALFDFQATGGGEAELRWQIRE